MDTSWSNLIRIYDSYTLGFDCYGVPQEFATIARKLLQWPASIMVCVIRSLCWICLILKLNNQLNGNCVAPADEAVEYQSLVFDPGYGQNISSGERIFYSGPPNAAIDTAWGAFHRAKYARISKQEAEQLDTPTAMLEDGSGYIISLDIFHQLHCLVSEWIYRGLQSIEERSW